MNRHPDPRRLAVGLFTLLVAVVVVAGWDGRASATFVVANKMSVRLSHSARSAHTTRVGVASANASHSTSPSGSSPFEYHPRSRSSTSSSIPPEREGCSLAGWRSSIAIPS